jgi:cytochrome c
MNAIRFVVVFYLGALIISLSLSQIHPFGDAQLNAQNTGKAALLEHSSTPDEVRAILTEKCADCHSDETRVPIYGRLAPMSWLLESDIVQGRAAMNLSQWDKYSTARQDAFKASIAFRVRTHDMPLIQYRLVHWNAEITDTDIRTLTRWAEQASFQVPDSTEPVAMEGDAARGKDVFERRCTGCHAMERDREGPRLRDVFGRTSGTVSGFAYSAALQKANIVWNDTALEKWLTDPDAMVPDNNMSFRVARPQERLDLIRFLRESAAQ